MPGRRPSRLRFCSKWLGSAAWAADGICNARRSTPDVERMDVVGPAVKMELDGKDTAPAPDSVIQNHDDETWK